MLSGCILYLSALPAMMGLVIGSADARVFGGEAVFQIAKRMEGCPGFLLHMYDSYGHAAYDTAPDYKERVMEFLAAKVDENID